MPTTNDTYGLALPGGMHPKNRGWKAGSLAGHVLRDVELVGDDARVVCELLTQDFDDVLPLAPRHAVLRAGLHLLDKLLHRLGETEAATNCEVGADELHDGILAVA